MEDSSSNTILHMAGMLTEHTPIDHIRGAALQMQREVQWFKEVEHICPLSCKERLNRDGLTPKQLFTATHQKLKERGEKWMKGTATSSTVVGALVITITFAAAFTIPDGNNQDTGLPILLDNKLFKIFMVTNTMSLFSSSTSVLTFLGILTARYAEEDFLTSLLKRMIIGLFTLFFSITTMMIAFSSALLLILRGQIWFVAPIIGLAGVPIILFALMQSRLLFDMVVSTYGPGIFDRKMKAWL
ncbi:ankyrin repeat-containing protein ITN1-like [Juglans regia]|uniref:Ankyrin repeat-containing protein ITN1-like n=1 Tax=Juglans regia TaxID=51240 RepID=A0A6P9EF03_JUGRE|nr:ankyrin repeat-containing protein ITN1-like [Juglans regia]